MLVQLAAQAAQVQPMPTGPAVGMPQAPIGPGMPGQGSHLSHFNADAGAPPMGMAGPGLVKRSASERGLKLGSKAALRPDWIPAQRLTPGA